MDRTSYVAGRYGLFRTPPEMVPAGKCDVSGNGRWRIWEFAGTKIDAPILGNGDLLSAFAWPARYLQFWLTTNDFWQMESNPNYEFFHDNAVAKRDRPWRWGVQGRWAASCSTSPNTRTPPARCARNT